MVQDGGNMSNQIIETGKRLQEKAVQVQEEYVDFMTPMKESRDKRFKDMKYAWDKNGDLFKDRNDYLRSLPKNEDGDPVIHTDKDAMNTFHELAGEFDWDMEFEQEWILGNGYVSALDFDEYYTITE